MYLNRSVNIGRASLGRVWLDHANRCHGEACVELTVACCRLRQTRNAEQLLDRAIFGDRSVAPRSHAIRSSVQELEELQARQALNALLLAGAVDAAGCADLAPARDCRSVLASRAEGGAGALRAQQKWRSRASRARTAVARVTRHRARPAEHVARVAEACGVGSVSSRAFFDALSSVVQSHIRSRGRLWARQAARLIWTVASGAARVALTAGAGGRQIRAGAARRLTRVVDQHGVNPVLSCRSETGRKERRKRAVLLPAGEAFRRSLNYGSSCEVDWCRDRLANIAVIVGAVDALAPELPLAGATGH